MKHVLFSFCTVLLLSYSIAFDEVRTLQLNASDISQFEIDAGAGYLIITGDESVTEITVKATIRVDHVDKDEFDSFVTLSLEQHGSKALLISKFDRKNFYDLFDNNDARIDLDITVPFNMTLDIDDGAGLVRIKHLEGNVGLDDGSGSIDIHDIIGNIDIEDGSGTIILGTLSGDIEIDDGSGEIDIDQVTGDIHIDDGSGTIDVKSVNGSVTIDDGSGEIILSNIENDVIIEDDGSGGLSLNNIKGAVKRYDK